MNGYQPPSLGQALKIASAHHQEMTSGATPSAGAYVAATLSAIAYAVFGAGLVPILSVFREMALTDAMEWDSPDPGILTSLMMFGGVMVGATVAFGAVHGAKDVFVGINLSTGSGLLGTAVGMLIARGGWSPEAYVPGTGPLWMDVAHWAPIWLPGVLGGLGVVLLVLAARRISSNAARGQEAQQLKQAGHQTTGKVLTASFTNTWVFGKPVFDVTVGFMAPQGPVQTSGRLTLPPMMAPNPGLPVLVTYNPHDLSKVFLELDPTAQPMWAPGLIPD
ncbi:MAG: hypothetical protein Q4G35_02270 [Propionibacteriaceae bacterium]|nr:hypothetical protein [Propionibacteriaceae bacterium]